MEPRELLDALAVADRLKDTTRHCYTVGGRHESVAEHSWRAALMAYFLRDKFPEADMDKVIKMLLIHDLGESFTGDIPSFRKTEENETTEEKLLYNWVASLPQPYAAEMRALYEEMAARETTEAKIYKAIDNFEAVIQHNESPLSTWIPDEYELNRTYGWDKAAFSPYLTALRQEMLEDTEKKIYRFTRKFLQEQGFERYEISNYAKPGKECRHNIGYWTEVAYLGLGLGASSYMEGCRFTNEKDLDKYLALDFGEEDPEKRETALRKLWGQIEELSQAQRMEEFMFLGLRMLKGVSDVDFVRLFGVKMETVYGDVIRRLTANGLLKKEENNLALTEWGMDVSNFVLSEFLLG